MKVFFPPRSAVKVPWRLHYMTNSAKPICFPNALEDGFWATPTLWLRHFRSRKFSGPQDFSRRLYSLVKICCDGVYYMSFQCLENAHKSKRTEGRWTIGKRRVPSMRFKLRTSWSQIKSGSKPSLAFTKVLSAQQLKRVGCFRVSSQYHVQKLIYSSSYTKFDYGIR